MAICPSCNENAISAIGKLMSDEARCVRCENCGSWAYAPSWLRELTVFSALEVFTFAGAVTALWFYLNRSPGPLLAVMTAAAIHAVMRIRFTRMIPVSAEEADARHTWGRAFLWIGVAFSAGILLLAVLRCLFVLTVFQ